MRETRYDIDDFFKDRYSPREFTGIEAAKEDLLAIMEAAGTAPSCYNLQPWLFFTSGKQKFLDVLSKGNVSWCDKLDTFILIAYKPVFDAKRDKPEKPNDWAQFDCGCAWGFMQLEAAKRGYRLHAMAGFDRQRAKDVFGTGDYEPLAVVAVGKAEKAKEFTPRKSVDDILKFV